jgi:hypothetical protein
VAVFAGDMSEPFGDAFLVGPIHFQAGFCAPQKRRLPHKHRRLN